MLLLAIDTSGKLGSIALANIGEPFANEIELIETVPLAGGTFSAQLVPQVAGLLSSQGFTKGDICAFAVAAGPGSFTGLRVGLAAVKALAEVLHKPIAAVSLLELCAFVSGAQARVMAALNAGRGDVYVGEYEIPAKPHQVTPEYLLSQEEFLARAKGRTIATPDSALAEMAGAAGAFVTTLPAISAADVARLGWRKLQLGQTVTPELLEANYIRRTDAEMLEKSVHNVRIRRANPSDIPAMMNLQRENPAAPHWPRQQYADLFQKNSERSEHCVWLLEVAAEGQPVAPDTDSPKIIAFLVARRVDVEWELENIVVAATHRRRGLGGLLLRELISHAQAAAGKNVFLEVRQSNRRARAFYQKFGFVETGVRKNYYPTHDSMAAEDAVLYRLSIA